VRVLTLYTVCLYSHRSSEVRLDENRRIASQLCGGPTRSLVEDIHVHFPHHQDSAWRATHVVDVCSPCSLLSDGEPMCAKCFSSFLLTSDIPREMYNRFCTVMWLTMEPCYPSCAEPINKNLPFTTPTCTRCGMSTHFDVDPVTFSNFCLAVCMGTHQRLGKKSPILDLSPELIRMICQTNNDHCLGVHGTCGM
jgi:hypothetical protein